MVPANGSEFVVGAQRHEFDVDLRERLRIGPEALSQGACAGQSAGVQLGVDDLRQFCLASPLMGKGQQLDHDTAGAFCALLFDKHIEGAGIGLARKDAIPVDQVQQRHRLLAQGVDYMPVIDDVAGLAILLRTPAPERHQMRRPQETFEAVIEKMDAQAMAYEARGNGVENLAQSEAATRRHRNMGLIKVGCAPFRQRPQLCPLKIDLFAAARIVPSDNLVDEAAIAVQVREVARAAQQQRIFDGFLEMAVRAFDGTVLVGDATVVARRRNGVMA